MEDIFVYQSDRALNYDLEPPHSPLEPKKDVLNILKMSRDSKVCLALSRKFLGIAEFTGELFLTDKKLTWAILEDLHTKIAQPNQSTVFNFKL